MFSTIFDDVRSSGIGGAYERKKIREWYKNNKGKLVIVSGSETIGCKKGAVGSSYDCTFNAQIVNHTDDELTALVLKIKAYNKKNNSLVTEETITLPISIFPTVKKSINVEFISSQFGNARSQLGKNFIWNYELAAYLPNHFYKHARTYGELLEAGSRDYDWLAE